MATTDVSVQYWLWRFVLPIIVLILVIIRYRKYIFGYLQKLEFGYLSYLAESYSTIQHDSLCGEKKRFFEEELQNVAAPAIVEIGNSYGMNFRYYPKGSKMSFVSALGRCSSENLIEWRASDSRSVHLNHLWTLRSEEDIRNFFKSSRLKERDVFVLNGLLCRFPDYNLVLDSISRWIKKDGKLLIIEHVVAKKLQPTFLLQKLLRRINWRLPLGCDVTRRINLRDLEEAGFGDISVKEIWTKGFPWTWHLYRPYVYISCVKK